MNRPIVCIRYNKMKLMTPNGEVPYEESYAVGYPSLTPTGENENVIGISHKEGDNKYEINFINGETWEIYPIPPYDIGRDKQQLK